MEPGKDLAIAVFSKLGFSVAEIAESATPRADLRISDAENHYYVEVKDKLESEERGNDRRAVLAKGEVYEQRDSLYRDNRISGVLRSARKQLNETPKEPHAYQLIWFHADGIEADTKYRQAFATFYGYVHLVTSDYKATLPTIEAFYFDYSAAFEMRDVEAMIVSDHTQLQVCVNEFSDRTQEFQSSKLCQAFAAAGGLYDPRVLEASGKAICCRFDMARKDENATAQELQRHTGILYSPIRLNRYSASAEVNFLKRSAS